MSPTKSNYPGMDSVHKHPPVRRNQKPCPYCTFNHTDKDGQHYGKAYREIPRLSLRLYSNGRLHIAWFWKEQNMLVPRGYSDRLSNCPFCNRKLLPEV